MKIDPTLKPVAPAKVKEVKDGKSSAMARQAHRQAVHDQVDLTGDATRLRELESRLALLDLSDPGKIEAIRQAIADGSFKVDEGTVADAMVKEALDFLSRVQR